MRKQATVPPLGQFFSVRASSLAIGSPLPFELYLWDGGQPVNVRRRGEMLSADDVKLLAKHRLLVPEDQRAEYLTSLKTGIASPDSPADLKSKFIKESAFLHMHGLFTRAEI